MKAEIINRPGNAAAKLSLESREKVTAEGGAMIAMSADMQIETSAHTKGKGGFRKAAKRMLAGENFFLNHFTAGENGGELYLATVMPGDMQVIELSEKKLVVQSGSFVAGESGVNMDMGWQGFKSLFSGESLFWINMSGSGKVIVNSFGAIYAINVKDEYIVDTGHIVAFDESLTFSISKAGKSWISSFLGGEGLICKFSGTGRIWCQSHNAGAFGKTIAPMLLPKKN